MKKFLTGVIALLLVLTACASPRADEENARQALVTFFDLLNSGQYAAADALYGGSYESLAAMNPDLDIADHAALWERGCTQNGLQCLTVRSATPGKSSDGIFLFKVEFNATDGNLFIQGPCCGATETEMPSQSLFDYHVIDLEGQYKVIDLPVYTP
jgi:hypothetical protein